MAAFVGFKDAKNALVGGRATPLGASGTSVLAPSAIQSLCPPWKPGAPR